MASDETQQDGELATDSKSILKRKAQQSGRCPICFQPTRPALDLDALAQETVRELLANDGFAYADRIPDQFEAIIRRALATAKGDA